tara:strand:- start:37 stop:312 length:276 start_codon:yes stop_codon:yes gene_type:complete
MAIIKYTSSIGEVAKSSPAPSGISDGGYFYDADNNLAIGIGTSGGTEITKAELITHVVSLDINKPSNSETLATNAEKTTMANDWCTERGIS